MVLVAEIKYLLELNKRLEKYVENKAMFEDDSETLSRIEDIEYVIEQDIIKKGIDRANVALKTGIPLSMKTDYFNKYLKYKKKYLELKKQMKK